MGEQRQPITFFDFTGIAACCSWKNEPTRWRLDSGQASLIIEPDAPTDFWQRTHYGFEADSGHFLFLEAAGDFILTARVQFQPRHQYDQAGLMVRVSEVCWLKTSVEYDPEGPARLGAVVTNAGWSDWSTQAFPYAANDLQLRIRREASDYIVDAAGPDSTDWTQIRMAHLHEDCPGCPIQAGLYACSPKAPGYRAEFLFTRIEPGRVP